MPFLLCIRRVDRVAGRFPLFTFYLRVGEISRHAERTACSFLTVVAVAYHMDFWLTFHPNRGLPAATCRRSMHNDLLLDYANLIVDTYQITFLDNKSVTFF